MRQKKDIQMFEVLESTYRRLESDGELYLRECEGSATAAGGDVDTPGCVTTDQVLGPDGGTERGDGCMGKDDFHVPFPVMPVLFRYSTGSKGKKKKSRKGVTVVPSAKNPYAKGATTVVAESEGGVSEYSGAARDVFDWVTDSAPFVVAGAFGLNRGMCAGWTVGRDGVLTVYRPVLDGGSWRIASARLLEDGRMDVRDAFGLYSSRTEAEAVMEAVAEHHRKALAERAKGWHNDN